MRWLIMMLLVGAAAVAATPAKQQSRSPVYDAPWDIPESSEVLTDKPKPEPSNQPEGKPADTTKPSEADQRGTEQFPLVVKIIEAPHTNEESQRRPEDQPYKLHHWVEQVRNFVNKLSTSDWVAVGAVVVAALQFGALVYTVRVMVTNGRRQLRAYVFVENAWAKRIRDPEDVNEDRPNVRSVIFRIKNSGVTPAYKTRAFVVAAAVDSPVAAFSLEKEMTYYGSLAPNDDFIDCDAGDVVGFTEEDIMRERKSIVLVGRITYEDAFLGVRHSDFCYTVTGTESDDGEMDVHERGNDSN